MPLTPVPSPRKMDSLGLAILQGEGRRLVSERCHETKKGGVQFPERRPYRASCNPRLMMLRSLASVPC